MIVEAQVTINGSKAAVWAAITDIANAVEIISGIEKIEVIESPTGGLVGLKWKETRILFGKPATVEKWITEAKENAFYTTRAEDSGFVFVTTQRLSGNDGSITLTSSHETLPQGFGAKLKSLPMVFFKSVIKKAIRQDLNDIKKTVEERAVPTPYREGKFNALNEAKEWVAHDYGNTFFRQPMSSGGRLVVGPSSKHVEVMLALAQTWANQQFYVLYVLLISHSGAEPGRYQSPLIASFKDLQAFFHTYGSFFESDGRHHIWIGSPSNEGMLVYDQHNVVFAYGDVQSYEQILVSQEFTRKEFWFPSPHSHSYPPTNIEQEEQLLHHFPWQRSPLQEGDEWD